MTRTGPVESLTSALGFLTVVGRSMTPTSASMTWFPVVGALIGGVVGVAWWGAGEIWPPFLAAVVAVAVDLALTGALHHDGLADAADGLLPHADRERRLSIMRQPDVGSFGVMALATVTLVRVGSLQAVEPNPALLAGLWCGSRTAMAAIARALPYARSSGLAAPFVGGSAALVVILGVLIAVPLVAVAHGIAGVAALAAVAAMTAAVAALAVRRLGGFTGDVLGAAGLLGESVGLLVVAGRW